MEGSLWYVLTGTRGESNRMRILQAVDKRPRNANQLAEDLDLDYKTVRHHLDVLTENDIRRLAEREHRLHRVRGGLPLARGRTRRGVVRPGDRRAATHFHIAWRSRGSPVPAALRVPATASLWASDG